MYSLWSTGKLPKRKPSLWLSSRLPPNVISGATPNPSCGSDSTLEGKNIMIVWRLFEGLYPRDFYSGLSFVCHVGAFHVGLQLAMRHPSPSSTQFGCSHHEGSPVRLPFPDILVWQLRWSQLGVSSESGFPIWAWGKRFSHSHHLVIWAFIRTGAAHVTAIS